MLSTTLNNRYTLEAEIGRGGMGVVYRARDLQLNRVVAVKVLPHEFTHDVQFLARFKNEILNTARLQHQHIVAIYDVGVDGNTNYYVMQLIEGEDLKSLLATRGRLPGEEVIRYLAQVASALDFAHENGIIHRDIKPENILIDRRGVARVTDFGIARSMEGTRMTGGMIGTPEYMSPEQAQGIDADGRSDQYALAIVAYEMYTGTTPFRSTDTQPWALVNMHISVPPPDPRQYQHDLPEYTVRALGQALGKAAAYRYSTCTEFIKGLAGEVADAAGAPPEYQPEKPKLASSAMAVIIIIFLVGLVFIGGVLIVKPEIIGHSRHSDGIDSSQYSSSMPQSGPASVADQQIYPSRFASSAVMPPVQGKEVIYNYDPQLAFDDAPLTSWAPPGGEWRGAWLEAAFPSQVVVAKLRVMPGLDRDDYWEKNHRLKEAHLLFDGGRQQIVTFADERRLQEIIISPAVKTTKVRIEIIDVYTGYKYDDLLISTIEVWGH